MNKSVEETFTTIITRGKMTPSYLSGLSRVHFQKSPDYIRDKLYEKLRTTDRSKSSTSLHNKKKFLQLRRAMGGNNSVSTGLNRYETENRTNRYGNS